MRRRDFIALTSSAAAAWAAIPPASRRARAQGGVIPVIGFLSSRTPAQADYLVAAIRNGLSELGLVEGQNVAIEYRYADGHYERLPALAADLVDRRVAAIIAGGTSKPAIAAAKAVPIVFTTGYDPVSTGLVRSLNQPGDNVTGATFYSGALAAKQMQLLIEVAPKTVIFALLVNAESTGASSLVRDAETAVQTIGRELRVLNAGSEREIDAAFAALAKLPNSAMLIGVDPFFDSRPTQLVELAARYAKPVVYYLPEFVRLGGLMCYGASITDAYRQAGNYAGRIVKGEKPADLPVQLPTKFELSINLKTAKALGLTLPPTLLATATEIIE